MQATITLGKFTATIATDYEGNYGATIYDRDDTSIVDSSLLSAKTDRQAMDQTWLHLRDLNVAQVQEPDWANNGPKIVGFSHTADHHCLHCSRDQFGHAAIAWAMEVIPDYHNAVLLLTSMYPKDREGNLITAITLDEAENIRDTDEDQNVPRCGECGIALCEALPVLDVVLSGFDED